MDIDAKIKTVEFKPKEFLKLKGLPFTKFNESPIGGGSEFKRSWHWYTANLPTVVEKSLINIANEIWIDLQIRNIVPKHFPAALTGSDDKESYPFTFEVEKYVLSNPNWVVTVDHSVHLIITSRSHLATGDPIYTDVPVTIEREKLNTLFAILDENL